MLTSLRRVGAVICKSLLWFGLVILVVACASRQQPTATYELLIKNVRLVDAINGQQENQWVAVSEGKISYVGNSAPSQGYAEIEIDGVGKTLIPGLWDAHVHLTFDEDVQGSMNRLFIANGVTSVRDTGGLLGNVLAFWNKAQTELAPTIYFAGPLLDGEPTVYDGARPGFPKIAQTIRTPDEARAQVRWLAEQGVHLIKAYEMLSPQSFRAIVDEATKLGLPVTGHIPLSMTAESAVETGISSLEHLRNLQMACSDRKDKLFAQRRNIIDEEKTESGSALRRKLHVLQHFPAVRSYSPEQCAKFITKLARFQTVQVPTIALNGWVSAPYYIESEWQKTYQSLPVNVAKDWLQRSEAIAKQYLQPGEDLKQQKSISDWQQQFMQDLLNAGVPIMAGTDTPIFFLTPGFSLHLELESLVEAGLSPMQALESATLTPARYFGLDSKVGGIIPGMQADLVLLNKNPLDDIRHTQSIYAVIKNGNLLRRDMLDTLLEPNNFE